MFKVLIVEDHPLFRATLKDLLEAAFPDSSILEAANGQEAIKLFDAKSPEIVFLDINLPDANGIVLAKRMKANGSRASILMLTSHDCPEYRSAALANGADFYFVKGSVNAMQITETVASIVSEFP